ncbi:MAG: hypothetical protein PHG14_03170 [Desulfobacter postgatei]|uniref:hypothetical protein n=1 Tax=Desulfobacter postgatei TaxID=2293 RepID=UPI0023F2E38F|nr:hypothetical protein [Desulfobacter postgatei]MDD4272709.1 hypothetical protein [Desulfobacter postgatei]
MRITDPQVILNGEKDLIASVQKDLDLDAVRDLLKERLTAKALSPKGGQIVVHNNHVAFRLDYKININGSLLFDRNGNLIEDSESTASKQDTQDENDENAAPVSDLDDNLSIHFPDYDDDAPDDEPGQVKAEDTEPEELSDEMQGADPKLEIENLEDEPGFDQENLNILDSDDADELIDLSEEDDEDDIEDLNIDAFTDINLEDKENDENVVDDDISDILQENRNFWEKKKE